MKSMRDQSPMEPHDLCFTCYIETCPHASNGHLCPPYPKTSCEHHQPHAPGACPTCGAENEWRYFEKVTTWIEYDAYTRDDGKPTSEFEGMTIHAEWETEVHAREFRCANCDTDYPAEIASGYPVMKKEDK